MPGTEVAFDIREMKNFAGGMKDAYEEIKVKMTECQVKIVVLAKLLSTKMEKPTRDVTMTYTTSKKHNYVQTMGARENEDEAVKCATNLLFAYGVFLKKQGQPSEATWDEWGQEPWHRLSHGFRWPVTTKVLEDAKKEIPGSSSGTKKKEEPFQQGGDGPERGTSDWDAMHEVWNKMRFHQPPRDTNYNDLVVQVRDGACMVLEEFPEQKELLSEILERFFIARHVKKEDWTEA